MSKLSPTIEYAKVEVRLDGVTYVYELEPDENWPITGTFEVDIEEREVPIADSAQPWRVFEPGDRTAGIHLAGKLANATRSAAVPRVVTGGEKT